MKDKRPPNADNQASGQKNSFLPIIEFLSAPKATIVRPSGTRNWAKLHSDEKYFGSRFFMKDRL